MEYYIWSIILNTDTFVYCYSYYK